MMDVGDNDIFWKCKSHWILKYVYKQQFGKLAYTLANVSLFMLASYMMSVPYMLTLMVVFPQLEREKLPTII